MTAIRELVKEAGTNAAYSCCSVASVGGRGAGGSSAADRLAAGWCLPCQAVPVPGEVAIAWEGAGAAG